MKLYQGKSFWRNTIYQINVRSILMNLHETFMDQFLFIAIVTDTILHINSSIILRQAFFSTLVQRCNCSMFSFSLIRLLRSGIFLLSSFLLLCPPINIPSNGHDYLLTVNIDLHLR